MRRVAPLHKSWYEVAHGYQKRAVDHLCERGSAALFLDPGMGKTSITLAAFKALQDEGVVSTMLVVAPLRVCQLVWRQEALKWSEFRDLKIELLHGDKKRDALKRQADVYLINPEGVAWLCDTHWGKRLPFDVMTIDECFDKGTRVATPRGDRPIEDIREGDFVNTDIGPRRVLWAGSRCVPKDYLVRVFLENGEEIVCTPNHPFFTDAGWCRADRLAGRALYRDSDLSTMWDFLFDSRSDASLSGEAERYSVLLAILRAEEAARPTPRVGSPRAGDDAENLCREAFVERWRAGVCPSTEEHGQRAAGAWCEATDTWGQRARDVARRGRDGEDTSARFRVELPRGVGKEAARLSYLLQTGLRLPVADDCGRGGRGNAHGATQRAGQEEDGQAAGVRVARVSCEKRDCLVEVYDIAVEDAPRFFANGVLVHNCTKFKNTRAQRSKKLHPFADKMPRRWGLTGTPAPNGYMDLFGQMRMLDGGAALGKYVTHFRDRYFQAGRDGFSYELQKGADKGIEAAIEPYVMYASADDYLSLPPLQDHIIELELDKPTRTLYKTMKRDMLAQIDGAVVTAANAAATYSKLKQMANGAVYTVAPEYKVLHDVKLDALSDLVDELQGQQLLVGYEFQHDLARLLARFGPDTPFLGGGVSAKRAAEIEADWNAGKIPVLLAHPASAGHGLNLQGSGAKHLCWFSQTWDYELYEQFLRRIHRQGTTADRVINHKLIVKDTIDEEVEAALQGKETTQDRLLAALKSEIIRDDPKVVVNQGTDDMAIRRLSSPGAAGAVAAPAAAATQAAPGNGWAGAAAPQDEQRTEIANKIGGTSPAGWAPQEQQAIQTGGERIDAAQPQQGGMSHFSPQVQEAVGGDTGGWGQPEQTQTLNTAPAATSARKRRTKAEIEADNAKAAAPGGDGMLTIPQPEPYVLQTVGEPYKQLDYSITFDVGAFITGLVSMNVSVEVAATAALDVIETLRGTEPAGADNA